MAVPIATYLRIAEICQYLSADGNAKKLLFQGGGNRELQSRLIYLTRTSVQYLYDIDPDDSRLPLQANYMYSLCEPYISRANQIINSGTSGEIINPSTDQTVTLETPLLQFVVGEVGSPMNAGDTQLTITATGIVNPSVNVDLDGVEVAYGRSDRLSFTATYSTSNVIITFNVPVQNGQLYMIHYVRFLIS